MKHHRDVRGYGSTDRDCDCEAINTGGDQMWRFTEMQVFCECDHKIRIRGDAYHRLSIAPSTWMWAHFTPHAAARTVVYLSL